MQIEKATTTKYKGKQYTHSKQNKNDNTREAPKHKKQYKPSKRSKYGHQYDDKYGSIYDSNNKTNNIKPTYIRKHSNKYKGINIIECNDFRPYHLRRNGAPWHKTLPKLRYDIMLNTLHAEKKINVVNDINEIIEQICILQNIEYIYIPNRIAAIEQMTELYSKYIKQISYDLKIRIMNYIYRYDDYDVNNDDGYKLTDSIGCDEDEIETDIRNDDDSDISTQEEEINYDEVYIDIRGNKELYI